MKLGFTNKRDRHLFCLNVCKPDCGSSFRKLINVSAETSTSGYSLTDLISRFEQRLNVRLGFNEIISILLEFERHDRKYLVN